MTVRTIWKALGSALVGGTVGYNLHDPIAKSKSSDFVQNDISVVCEQLKNQGYTEIHAPKRSFISSWHQQYMFSHAIGAKPQMSLFEPETKTTQLLYCLNGQQVENLVDIFPTIFDEGLAAVGFKGLPNHIGVTGTLEISALDNSTSPEEGGILILKASPVDAKGRKSTCSGQLIWAGTAKPIATGKVIMIEPWWGKYLSKIM